MKVTYFLILSIVAFWSITSFADNRSDQMNPNNDAYWESRGHDERPSDWEGISNNSSYEYSKSELNNRSNQMNSNNDAYWRSRGYQEKSDEWEDSVYEFSKGNNSRQQTYNNQSYLQLKEPNKPKTLKNRASLSNKQVKNNEEGKVDFILEILIHWLSIR